MNSEELQNVVNDTKTLPYCCRVDRGDEDGETIAKRLEARWGKDITSITFILWCFSTAYQRIQISMGVDLLECRNHINLRNIEIERLRGDTDSLRAEIDRLKSVNKYLEDEAQRNFLNRESQSGPKS